MTEKIEGLFELLYAHLEGDPNACDFLGEIEDYAANLAEDLANLRIDYENLYDYNVRRDMVEMRRRSR
jgi:hypothetical protein